MIKKAMVMLASEQLSPNIEGLLAIHSEETPVVQLFIYCTNGVQSLAPAQKLKNMAEGFLKGSITVQVHQPQNEEDGTNPVHVTQAIQKWFNSCQEEQLVINATGGLKTMFAGVIPFLQNPKALVFYRHTNDKWLKLSQDENSIVSTELKIEKDHLSAQFKKLSIKQLVGWQSGFSNISAEKPLAVDCVTGLKNVAEKKWDWTALPSTLTGGFAFEQWFASLLASFQPDDLITSLKVIDTSGEESKRTGMETDVWALKNAKLSFFDLKLKTKNDMDASLAEQITNASAQVKKFAGSNAKAILIRPGYSYSEQERKSFNKLAGRFSCEIWFQEDMVNILELLESIFTTESLHKKKLKPLLNSAYSSLGCLFSNPNFIRSIVQSEKGQNEINIENVFSTLVKTDSRWLGFNLGEYHLYRVAKSDVCNLDNWCKMLQTKGCVTKKIGSTGLFVQAPHGSPAKYLNENKGKQTNCLLFPV